MRQIFTFKFITKSLLIFLVIFWSYKWYRKYQDERKYNIPVEKILDDDYRKRYGLPKVEIDENSKKDAINSKDKIIRIKLKDSVLRQFFYIKEGSIETNDFVLPNRDTLTIGFDHVSKEPINGIVLNSFGNISFNDFYNRLKPNEKTFSNDSLFYNQKIKSFSKSNSKMQ